MVVNMDNEKMVLVRNEDGVFIVFNRKDEHD